MDNTIFFERFGLNPDNFFNRKYETVTTENGLIYEADEAFQNRTCPHCRYQFMHIHSRRYMTRIITSSISLKEELRIKRIRYFCPGCQKTHTFSLEGLPRNKNLSEQMIKAIQLEFFNVQSFSDIASRYGVSVQTIINIFNETTKLVPRRKMPDYLCIDEKHFEGDTTGKYCVVLSDFFSGEVIDVLPDRQMPYLNDYFSMISSEESRQVKVVISDMYEGYASIKNKYFPKAIYVIDLFHVVRLLSTAVNKLRIRTYNQMALEETIERHFLKTNWKVFLCDQYKINKSIYHSQKYDLYISYGEIILSCLKFYQPFWDGYHILQELIHYDHYESFTDALNFVDRIISKLKGSGEELLEKVAVSYHKWRVGIANGLAKNQTGKRFSNSTRISRRIWF